MATPQLPFTSTKLSTSVTIRIIPMDTVSATSLTSGALTSAIAAAVSLGAIESFSETNDRKTYQRL